MATKRNDKLERRSFKFSIDSVNEEAGKFTGYASVFGGVDSYGDTIVPGAFKKTLKEHKFFPLTWTHSPMEPLGIAYLEEDSKGLKVKSGELNLDVRRAVELRSLMVQRAVTGMSIGFRAIKYELNEDGTGRQLKEVALGEVALCLFPADEDAQVAEVKATGFETREDFYEATGPWLEQKPYPNEHSCRLQDPGKFDKFRRGTRKHEGKEYSIIFGHVKGGEEWEEQAYRYDKDAWTASEAKAHCAAHKGTFEAAEKCDDCNFDDTEPGNTPPEPKPEDKAQESAALALRVASEEFKNLLVSHN